MYTCQEVQHTCCASKKYIQYSLFANKLQNVNLDQGGITCGAIEDASRSSKGIDERVIMNLRDKMP